MLNADSKDCMSTDFHLDLPEGRIAARRIDPPGGTAADAPAMVFLHEALGLSEIPCFDLRAQCSGFVYSLACANGFIKANMFRRSRGGLR